jgi:mRNA-degrading endonuclease toxin of MazEF toxin-antitoxin module
MLNSGVVLSDQVKSLDWTARHAEFKGRMEPEALAETVGKIKAQIDAE